MAGGDSLAYLRGLAIEAEDQLIAVAAKSGIDPDVFALNIEPPYPVLYAATISRPSGLLTLRGETQPYGQYTLFVPPDGELLDVSFYDPKTKGFAFITPNLSPKAKYELPRFNLSPLAADARDFDKDGLPDVVEDVYGTNPSKSDTDGDGIPDGAEIEQGTDPLGGLVVRTGVIATVKTPGAAIDIATGNDLAIVAQGEGGVAVLNISKITQPTIIVQVDTPGTAQRVAFSGNLVAVADGSAGLAVLDISDPVTARIIHQVNLPGAQAIAASAGLAYVGLSSGRVIAVNLVDGTILNQVNVTNAVQDLALDGDYLYALTGDRLHVISLVDGILGHVGSAASPFVVGQNQRLFVGGGIAYTVYPKGYNTIEVTNPAKPVLLTRGSSTQVGWRQIVANGSGLGLAAVGPNLADDGPHDISLFDVSNSRVTDVVTTAFPTPGNARAVSIFNGLAYVADDAFGMQVVNYLPYDAKGVPPTISLTTSFSGNSVVEGTPIRVTANVGDDVQVRNVEFHLDGVKVFTDSAFPFEFRFVPPRLTVNTKSFRLRARAVDTGGNSTWTEEVTVTLLPDTTPPRVTQYSPLGGGKAVRNFSVYFDGPVNAATLNAGSFKLFSAGNDGLPGTADDLPVNGGVVSYREETKSATLSFTSPLPDGRYRAVLSTAVADLAGNRMASDYVWQFRVADAVFWIRTTDGLWSDPLNWSTGAVPGPDDNVVIDLAQDDVTVALGAGTTMIKSLLSTERINVTLGTLQAPGGIQISGNLTLERATVRGGTVTATGGAKLVCVGNPGSTLDGVTLNGDLDVTSFIARVFIRNGLKLTGSVLLENGGNITFVGDQTLDTGTLSFDGGYLTVADNTTLTLGPAVVLRGQRGSVTGNGTLINQGLISADVARGTLAIDAGRFTNLGTSECKNGASLTIRATTWNNAGVINATGAGELTLSEAWTNTGAINADGAIINLGGAFTLAQLGAFNRTGGTVNVAGVLNLTGNTLALTATTGSWVINGGTIRGGTVTATGGTKLICVGNPGSTLDGVTLNGDLDVTSFIARVFIRNGLKLAGSVLIENGGNITFVGDQTLDTGAIVFTRSTGQMVVDINTALTLGPAVVVHGNIGQVLGAGKLLNQGLIAADVERGTITISTGQLENTGKLAATAASATLRISAKAFTNTGTTQEANGGKIVIVP